MRRFFKLEPADSPTAVTTHGYLARYFTHRYQLKQAHFAHAVSELPYHLRLAGRFDELIALLTDLAFIQHKVGPSLSVIPFVHICIIDEPRSNGLVGETWFCRDAPKHLTSASRDVARQIAAMPLGIWGLHYC